MSLVRDAAGRPLTRLTIATDITEEEEARGQVLRAQRVETLGMLAAGIAHDLNNVPQAPVDMVASMLRLRVTDPEISRCFLTSSRTARSRARASSARSSASLEAPPAASS